MEPVAVLAVSRAASIAADAACVIAFVASVAVVVVTGLEKPVPRLAAARLACVVVTGVLVGSSLAGFVDRWGLALACVAFLVSLQAVALAFGRLAPLQSFLDRLTAEGEAGWADFERSFQRYVARRDHRCRLWRSRASEPSLFEPEDRVERSES
jgi:hypothetical protein